MAPEYRRSTIRRARRSHWSCPFQHRMTRWEVMERKSNKSSGGIPFYHRGRDDPRLEPGCLSDAGSTSGEPQHPRHHRGRPFDGWSGLQGIAISVDGAGTARLYVTNFHAGTVEVFDTGFSPATPFGAFADPHLPKNYAPFNIALVGSKLVVTYAVQDADKHDDVAGMGHGVVDTFDLAGQFVSTPHSARP